MSADRVRGRRQGGRRSVSMSADRVRGRRQGATADQPKIEPTPVIYIISVGSVHRDLYYFCEVGSP